MWDDYYYGHNTIDEDNWERMRDDKIGRVQDLIDFLITLKAVRHWDVADGYNVTGFVDRNWKA